AARQTDVHVQAIRMKSTSLIATVLLGLFVLVGLASAQIAVVPARIVDKTEAEKWREDLRFMAEEMPKYHRNLFHQMTREQFQTAVAKLYERIPALARNQIIVEMARIVALVGDGHTNLSPTRDPKVGFRTLP